MWGDVSKQKNKRVTVLQNQISMLYNRYNDDLITVSDLLIDLSFVITKKSYDCDSLIF